MLYFAGILFILAMVTVGLDLSRFRFAHGAGMATNVLIFMAFACVIARGINLAEGG